jgi:hypothetical protein
LIQKPECPSCKSSKLFRTVKNFTSGGGYSPNLLPGLAGTFKTARMRTVVCGDCGHMQLVAERELLRALTNSKHWERI